MTGQVLKGLRASVNPTRGHHAAHPVERPWAAAGLAGLWVPRQVFLDFPQNKHLNA